MWVQHLEVELSLSWNTPELTLDIVLCQGEGWELLHWNRQWHGPHIVKTHDIPYYRAGKKKIILIRSEGPALPVVFRMFCKGFFVQSSISIQCSDVTVPIVDALDSLFSWYTCFLCYHLTLNKMVVLMFTPLHTFFLKEGVKYLWLQ